VINLATHSDDLGQAAGVDDLLNLSVSASGNVGKQPANFLDNAAPGAVEERDHSLQSVSVQASVSLSVASRDDVANDADARRQRTDIGGVRQDTDDLKVKFDDKR
jgi:hypothetical protein